MKLGFNFSQILNKTILFLEKLSSKPKIAGLEITAGSLKYAFFDDNKIKTFALKLPPGVIVNGKLAQKDSLVSILQNFKKNIGAKEKEFLKVNVVLPAEIVFTQTINVPAISFDELKEAIELNLQMISPLPKDEVNMSARVLEQDDTSYKVFAAIVPKKEIALYEEALNLGGFIPISFEIASLSIARFIKKYLGEKSLPLSIVIIFFPEGLEIFLLKENKVVFDHFKSWQVLQKDSPGITKEYLSLIISEEIKQVLNFAALKFGINISELFIIAPGLESLLKEIISNNFSLKVSPLVIPGINLNTFFYVSVGAALRFTEEENVEDLPFGSINLGGKDIQKMVFEEQLINFVVLWRWILVAVFGFLIFVYFLGYIFIVQQYKNFSTMVFNFKPPLNKTELERLTALAKDFNLAVFSIKNVKGEQKIDFYEKLKLVLDVFEKNNITIKSLDIFSFEKPISLLGNATSYENLIKFKDTLLKDENFSNVDLPLNRIINQPDNSVDFYLNFSFK